MRQAEAAAPPPGLPEPIYVDLAPPEEMAEQSVAPAEEPVEEVAIGPQGSLYTYTIVHPGKDSEPYALAMVDFAPDVRAFGRLILDGGNAPKIGSAVRVVPFDMADGTADYAFAAVPGVQ